MPSSISTSGPLTARVVGQSTLPSSCPVCEHTPVAAEDCKPHKSLRTTIKVFLRTEEKKREAVRVKEEKKSPAAVTPAPLVEIPTPVAEAVAQPSKEAEAAEEIATEETPAGPLEPEATRPEGSEALTETQQDVPQPSIEVSFVGVAMSSLC